LRDDLNNRELAITTFDVDGDILDRSVKNDTRVHSRHNVISTRLGRDINGTLIKEE
jgi:hypothetical protein